MLLVGPPGAGKSMLAAWLSTILPPLTPAELLDVSMIAFVAGEIEGGALTNRRPFRAPHHSASMPAPGRGRPERAARGPPRRVVPRRAPRVSAACARCLAPTAGDRRGLHRAGEPSRDLSGAVHAGRGHQPVPLRARRRARLYLQGAGRTRVNSRSRMKRRATDAKARPWKKLARLLRTKQQLAWLCEMPPTRGYPHRLKGRHEFPNFRSLLTAPVNRNCASSASAGRAVSARPSTRDNRSSRPGSTMPTGPPHCRHRLRSGKHR